MDIQVTKSHMHGNAWVHPGDSLDVDESHANDLFRNGLARPLIVLRVRETEEKPAKPAKSKPAPATANKGAKPPSVADGAIAVPPSENATTELAASLSNDSAGDTGSGAGTGSENAEQDDAAGQS